VSSAATGRKPKALPTDLDVAIIGAGAAGVGMGVVLRDLGVKRFALLERQRVGASFDAWPAEMRMITPSFPSHAFGMLDLNAVALRTSPGFSLATEHPTGPDYARYLRGVAKHWKLPIHNNVDVSAVQYMADDDRFMVETSRGPVRSRFVVWAAGEFQYPRLFPFPGADLCRHNSQVKAWATLPGDDFVVIGGYESGVDAAVHLSRYGKRVRVLDPAASWDNDNPDPSQSLSPFTNERLDIALDDERIELIGDVRVTRVERTDGGYVVCAEDGRTWTTQQPPILAWTDEGHAMLTAEDESTVTPGLFVVGPRVRQAAVIFCFIYKFRQRFAVVANAIGGRLGLDTAPMVRVYRAGGMYLDDLSCCVDECAC
jgi:putative flavoprotein involved in K+ transport